MYTETHFSLHYSHFTQPTQKMTTYWVLDKNEFDSGNVDPSARHSVDDLTPGGNHRVPSYLDRKRGSVRSLESCMLLSYII